MEVAVDGDWPEKTEERKSILDVSWPEGLVRKRGDGSTMELKITDMNKEGQAFLIDRVTRGGYKRKEGDKIREAEPMYRYPANVPAREVLWINHDIFRPITFDSLEGAEHYIDHLVGLYEKERLALLKEKASS
jgi:hypothetical protein